MKGGGTVPTIDEALAYLGIDYADELVKTNVQRALQTAQKVLHGAVGDAAEEVLPDDARIDSLVLIYTDDLYSERGVSAKVSAATRRIVADMELQLRLEYRRAKEAAGA